MSQGKKQGADVVRSRRRCLRIAFYGLSMVLLAGNAKLGEVVYHALSMPADWQHHDVFLGQPASDLVKSQTADPMTPEFFLPSAPVVSTGVDGTAIHIPLAREAVHAMPGDELAVYPPTLAAATPPR